MLRRAVLRRPNRTAHEAARDRRLGVLAFGDSITNGGGELQWGVALHSWAQWVAAEIGRASCRERVYACV